MRKSIIFLSLILILALIPGCKQQEVPSSEEPSRPIQQESELPPEPTVELVDSPEPLPQPQADGTGISFALPDDWNKYPSDALQDLQAMINESGNRVLYGVLHGFMEAQEISEVFLADSSVEDYGDMVHYYPAYDVSLDDGTILRLKFAATGWNSGEDSDGGMYFDGLYFVEVYPAFEDCYWSLELEYDENMEGRYDWVYQIENGNIVQYYSISERTLNEYTPYDETAPQPRLDYSAMGWPGAADQSWEEYYYDGGQFYYDEYGQYFCKVYGTTLYWDAGVNNWFYRSKDMQNCYRWNGTNYYVAGLDFSWAYDVNVTGIWYWIDFSGVSKTNPPSEYTDYVQSEIERFTDDDFENSIEEWTETYGYTVYQDDNGQWTCEAPYGYWKYYPDEGRYGRWRGVIDIYNLWTEKVEDSGVSVRVSVIKGYKISFYDERGSEEIAKVSASVPDSFPNPV